MSGDTDKLEELIDAGSAELGGLPPDMKPPKPPKPFVRDVENPSPHATDGAGTPSRPPAWGSDTPQPAPMPISLSAEQLAGLLKMPFSFMAKRGGEYWELTDLEAEQWAGAVKQVLDKYQIAPSPEVTLVLVTLLIVAPRAGTYLMTAKEKKQQSLDRKIEGLGKVNTDLKSPPPATPPPDEPVRVGDLVKKDGQPKTGTGQTDSEEGVKDWQQQ